MSGQTNAPTTWGKEKDRNYIDLATKTKAFVPAPDRYTNVLESDLRHKERSASYSLYRHAR